MLRYALVPALLLFAYLRLAHLASIIPAAQILVQSKPASGQSEDSIKLLPTSSNPSPQSTPDSRQTTMAGSSNAPTGFPTSGSAATSAATTAPNATVSSSTLDPNPDHDPEDPAAGPNSNLNSYSNTTGPATSAPNVESPSKPSGHHNGTGKPLPEDRSFSLELSVLFYSIFVVYVSLVKLMYHNIELISNNMTEPGILMIFGILWELVARQISANYEAFPRFNSRIFFYLFLPSTVLESASLLSNKWLFFNLLPILIHSIVGTLLYASSLGFTIYSLSRHDVFNLSVPTPTQPQPTAKIGAELVLNVTQSPRRRQDSLGVDLTDQVGYASAGPMLLHLNNLTLADCLIVGTILSSLDSTSMLGAFKLNQVNEKLYYLVLGENLMNNAVVLVLFNLLIDFLNATRLTVVKIYIAILQFFMTLIGAVFIGLVLAMVALVAVRLTKRFHMPNAISSYQNQCQAMVETLLILKLAYLTYTLASLAGTSSIVGLATFGILGDQYIKQNLNLRSQLALRQVVLATKTMGFSLVYPLLGMLLVEMANTNQFLQAWLSSEPSTFLGPDGGASQQQQQQLQVASAWSPLSAASVASSKLGQLANQANLNWNFKFLSIVTLLTIGYRFIIVFALGFLCNLLTSGQLRTRFREQILMAYGGLKGPLSIGLVQRLVEHEEHEERTARYKHLFTYTILFIIFISSALAGSLIRPLVRRVQLKLVGPQLSLAASQPQRATLVFDQINCRLTEYLSHGLNSILGHSKSPYDRFLEFNETHIKVWLVRAGSNTNWLSVFYDNLVLDETLNANCFYIATDDPTTMRRHRNQSPAGSLRRPRSSSPDIIEELATSGNGKVAALQGEHLSTTASLRPLEARHQLAGLADLANERTLLKEFVMLNLKLEGARARRRRSRDLSDSSRRTGRPHKRLEPTGDRKQNAERMLSTTSSGESVRETSSVERRAKNGHLLELQRQLDSQRSDKSRVHPLRLDSIEEDPTRIEVNHEAAAAVARRTATRKRSRHSQHQKKPLNMIRPDRK